MFFVVDEDEGSLVVEIALLLLGRGERPLLNFTSFVQLVWIFRES